MAAEPLQPIIIKRVEEDGHGGHHGGGWKVAYADFMTAMMAFFLLLWIVAASDEEQLRGLADYFTPSISTAGGRGQGLLSGTVVGDDGVLSGTDGPQSEVRLPSFGQENPLAVFDSRLREVEPTVIVEYEAAPEGATLQDPKLEVENPTPQEQDPGQDQANPQASPGDAPEVAPNPGEGGVQDAQARRQAERERHLEELKDEIGMVIREHPDLKPFLNNVIFDKTEDGLRVQIIDQEGRSMFNSGSAQIGAPVRDLIAIVGQAVAGIPNDIVISGHTDAVPYTNDVAYGNWELSTDRANATRRLLIAAGVNPNRITRISGLADTEPLNPENPDAPENRRISVLLAYPDVDLAPSEGRSQ